MIPLLHAVALAHPEVLDGLPDDLLAILVHSPEFLIRPEQVLPDGNWRSYGYLTGRGYGKTHAIAEKINRRVEAGTILSPALIAPTFDRVNEVQVASIIETSSPWFRAERYKRGVRWANGVVAEAATAEVERPSSGSNYDFVWMTEIVKWAPTTRMAAYNDITTACRAGGNPQYVWDTTSSGKNDVILSLLERGEMDPVNHRIVRGTMFDNPILPEQYVRDEIAKYTKGTRVYDEEILGLVFSEAAGALWRDDWIYPHRVDLWPSLATNTILGLDPALSDSKHADEVGICKAAIAGGHIYVTDLSDRMTPEDYARVVVRECQRDASGVVVERNHVGQHARDLIRVHARLAGMAIEILPDATRTMPARRPGTIYIREVISTSSKETRATPVAALYAAGKVHHVGTLVRLELEQTTWEPGSGRSPNRIDALVFAVGELGDTGRQTPRDPAGHIEAAKEVSKLVRRAHGRPRKRGGGLGL